MKQRQDPLAGEEAREEAMARVEAGANPEWLEECVKIGAELAREMDAFTTDHIWERLPDDAKTHEPRAMGAVMRNLSDLGVIERTDRTVNSHRPECHRRPVRLWRSKIKPGASA